MASSCPLPGAGAIPMKVLEEMPLFAGLTPAQLTGFVARLRRKVIAGGANLMMVEQPGELVYLIVSGTVKVHIEQEGGADVILAILGPGEIVGEMSILDNLARSASAVTLEEATLLWLDSASFREGLQAIPRLGYNLAHILAKRLRLANQQIQALSAMEVESRVAHQLLGFADRYGKPTADGDIVIPIRLTQGDIASMVGASCKRVNQVMVSYKERRYLSVDHAHHITIHNQKALVHRCAAS